MGTWLKLYEMKKSMRGELLKKNKTFLRVGRGTHYSLDTDCKLSKCSFLSKKFCVQFIIHFIKNGVTALVHILFGNEKV